MAQITQLDVRFGGTFQARMSVGMDASNASPTDPSGTHGSPSRGAGFSATYAYREKPFDRIIRLSKPVDLRNLQVTPWHDTVVDSVKMVVNGKFQSAPPGDPLTGRVVSLGDKVKWIEDEGYEIDSMVLSIDPFFVGRPTNRLDGYNMTTISSRKAEYQKEKAARLSNPDGGIDPIRLQVLLQNLQTKFDTWASIHMTAGTYSCSLDPRSLVFTASFGNAATMDAPANYLWGASLVVSHWDADTMCGRLRGALGALHKSTLSAGASAVPDIDQLIGRTFAG